jgi:hypothetical protein
MKRRYAVIGLALIAALAIASPSLGGPSLRSLVKKEVKKQLKGKTGPQGPAGAAGGAGATGAAGSARAYGRVDGNASSPCAPNCQLTISKGIASVTHTATGVYCVAVPGIADTDAIAIVSVDWSLTSSPEGNAQVTWASTTNCPNSSDFAVRTLRLPTAAPITAAAADDVAFEILIP